MTLKEFTANCSLNGVSVKVLEQNGDCLLASVMPKGRSPSYYVWIGNEVMLHTGDYIYALQRFRGLV